MSHHADGSTRKIAVISIILNVVTISLSQLAIAFKHSFFSPKCNYETTSENEIKGIGLEDRNCTRMFEFGIAFLDAILVTITMFSIVLDLPSNIMLFLALHSKVSRMFLPWMLVTALKIIGCIVISCVMMHLTIPEQSQAANKSCLIQDILHQRYVCNNYFLKRLAGSNLFIRYIL